MKNTVPNALPNPTCTSGVKSSGVPLTVRAGTCADVSSGALLQASSTDIITLQPSDGGTLTLRILADRSLADFFVANGRWAGTVAWEAKAPRRHAEDSAVIAWAASEGIMADVDVFSMGCGWIDPSYTDSPTL